MELSLSLGDKSKLLGLPLKVIPTTTAANGIGFCMALGTSSAGVGVDDDNTSEEREMGSKCSQRKMVCLDRPVQLDLLPFSPVPRHTPWSSDNGSSEGGSSGNVPVPRGLDVNRRLVVEEATSPFRMDLGVFSGVGSKRDFMDSRGNDVVDGERTSSRASDEDENGLSKKKLRLSKEQSAYLEESFKEHNTLNPKQKLALAKQLNLRARQVEVWFQNRRARTKLKQTEVDCEYLKRCCETLTEENRRLQKELQELRALKTTSNSPFYMQLPATTLTMCPSCERVATTTSTAPPTTTKPFHHSSTKQAKSLFPFSPNQNQSTAS